MAVLFGSFLNDTFIFVMDKEGNIVSLILFSLVINSIEESVVRCEANQIDRKTMIGDSFPTGNFTKRRNAAKGGFGKRDRPDQPVFQTTTNSYQNQGESRWRSIANHWLRCLFQKRRRIVRLTFWAASSYISSTVQLILYLVLAGCSGSIGSMTKR
jgi:hypothetical protein